jgi:hypothetical protein
MTVHQRQLDEALPAASPKPPGRGQWNWLRAAQWAWVVLALVLLATFVANLPAFYQIALTGCAQPSPVDCGTGLLSTGNFQALAKLHLSVTAAAVFLATLTLVVAVLYWVVGLLIFWRKSQEWAGLFFSFLFVLLGATGMFAFPGTTLTPPLIQSVTNSAAFALNFVLGIFFLTFPTGRFTPRWTWIASALYLMSTLPFMPGAVVLLTFFLPLGVQIYRYVRVYDAVQRQQTKWFVFGFGVFFSFLAIDFVLTSLMPGLSAPDSWFQLLNALAWPLIWTVLLVSVSVPILRYRLWDIDVIINRTLVYGSLTALLALLYFGLIFALQTLFQGIFKQNNAVAIVVSTLVIAALFQPLRHRIQQVIDRRFYRRKYDAAKTVEAFSATLRNEVDLSQLREHLITVVQETMQPAHVSLWLRKPEHDELHQLPQIDHSPVSFDGK